MIGRYNVEGTYDEKMVDMLCMYYASRAYSFCADQGRTISSLD